MGELERLRAELHAIDQQLIDLLFQRTRVVDHVKVYKQGTHLPAYQAAVQARKLQQVKSSLLTLHDGIDDQEIASVQLVLQLIMDLSVSKQLHDRQLLTKVTSLLNDYEQAVTGKLAADEEQKRG